MDNVRDALLRMYRGAKKLKNLSDGLRKLGMGDDPVFNAYGDVLDGIYYLIGETKPFEESVTRLLVEKMELPEDRAVDVLYGAYTANFSQPAPKTMSRDEMLAMYRKSGGYMSSTPEGEWK